MRYVIIATDDIENIVKYDCMVVLKCDNLIEKCWLVSVYDGEVEEVQLFPVEKIQSYYAHSSGMYSCELKCPEYIVSYLE